MVALAAWILYEGFRAVIVGAIRRTYEARVDRFIQEHDIPNDPFRHLHRVVVKEQVLSDPGLVEAMAERARSEHRPVAMVQAKVRAWLDEIVPQFNLLAYYAVGYRVGRLAAYSVYNVELNKASLEAARAKIPEGASVVYVSNHRSNADFIVTGFMLSKSVQVSYAVGEWARVWPLESLFKSFGSYFVRRGEKDPLYHRTLESYVQLVTKGGSTQAMFPEGGLSRDGALRPVKLGLLDNMLKAKLDPTFTAPLVFVPVGINFDRVLEDDNMVAEARGQGRPKRTLRRKLWRLTTLAGKGIVGGPINIVRFAAKRLKKHGVAAIHFGEPVVFDDWYAGKQFLAEPDRKTRWDAIQPFADGLLERIGRCIPATPATFLCLAASRIGPDRMAAGVDRGDIILAMREAHDALRDAGAPLVTGDPYARRERMRAIGTQHHREDLAAIALGVDEADDLDGLLARGLDVTGKRGIVVQEGDRFVSRRWDLVEYYANSLRAHLD